MVIYTKFFFCMCGVVFTIPPALQSPRSVSIGNVMICVLMS